MGKQTSVTLGFDDCPRESITMAESMGWWAKIKLLRLMATLSGYIRRQDRRQTEECYVPRKSREEESRLEFQRFIYCSPRNKNSKCGERS